MPRNISFAITTEQFLNRTKDVTRRLGWKFLNPGDLLMGCKKCMGFKKGEKIERLGLIQVVSVRREDLSDLTFDPIYGRQEMVREGFPNMSPNEFIAMFSKHNKCGQHTEITRIEFGYL